jgi:competence protein ComEC
MRYSVITISLSFASGILLGSLLPCSPLLLWATAVSLMIASICLSRWKRSLLGLLLASVALLGAVSYQSIPVVPASLYKKADNLRQITGTICSYPEIRDHHTMFTIDPDNIKFKIYVTLFWQGKTSPVLLYGDRVQIAGFGNAPENFDGFDYRNYLARQGIFATMIVESPSDVHRLGVKANSIMRLGDTIRQRLSSRIDALLPGQEAGLAHGLMFGDRGMMSDQVEDLFRRSGLMHLLAVSGLHLGIFLAALWFLLRLFGLRPRITYPLVGLLVLLILWVVGPRVSLVRASLLFAFLALGSVLADYGIILKRWVNSYCGLAAAGLVVLAARPVALWDVGFQLSFAATGAILFVFDRGFRLQGRITALAGRSSFPKAIISYALLLIAASAAAQAGTAPFLAYHFQTLYPFSLIASLVAIPLATVALWAGGFFIVFSFSPLAPVAAKPFYLFLHWLIVSVTKISHLPGSEIEVPTWAGIWIGGIVSYFFMLAIYLHYRSSCTLYSTSIVLPLADASSVVPPEDGSR